MKDSKDFERLRYAVSVDFYSMIDSGMTFEEAENWFKSDECIKEIYGNEWSAEEIQAAFDGYRKEFEKYQKGGQS